MRRAPACRGKTGSSRRLGDGSDNDEAVEERHLAWEHMSAGPAEIYVPEMRRAHRHVLGRVNGWFASLRQTSILVQRRKALKLVPEQIARGGVWVVMKPACP